MMRFSINWVFPSARKPVISLYDLPLSINEKFDCIHVSRVNVEKKPLSDHFWVDRDDGGNATQKIAVSN